MTVLVTGATGYLGRHLVARLRDDGFGVRALVRDASAGLPDDVDRHVLDLSAPGMALLAAVDGVRAIVNAAAHLDGGDRSTYGRVNVEGTAALLAAAAAAGVRRIVHLSSITVYGRKAAGSVVAAADGYDPCPALRDAYAWSKLEGDRWAECWRQTGHLDLVTLRPAIIHGRERRFVARIWRPVGRGVRVVAGSPGMLLPLVHVDDVVEAIVRALQRPGGETGPLTLVGPDAPTQAEWLARREDGVRTLYVPTGAARRLAGWQAARALDGRASGTRRAYQLAWATQSVRYDRSACTAELGWAPRIPSTETAQRAA